MPNTQQHDRVGKGFREQLIKRIERIARTLTDEKAGKAVFPKWERYRYEGEIKALGELLDSYNFHTLPPEADEQGQGVEVWCVCDPKGRMLYDTTALREGGSITNLLSQDEFYEKGVMWGTCIKQGYTVRRCRLVVINDNTQQQGQINE